MLARRTAPGRANRPCNRCADPYHTSSLRRQPARRLSLSGVADRAHLLRIPSTGHRLPRETTPSRPRTEWAPVRRPATASGEGEAARPGIVTGLPGAIGSEEESA